MFSNFSTATATTNYTQLRDTDSRGKFKRLSRSQVTGLEKSQGHKQIKHPISELRNYAAFSLCCLLEHVARQNDLTSDDGIKPQQELRLIDLKVSRQDLIEGDTRIIL